MKIQVVNQKNKSVGDVEVKEFTTDGKVSESILSQYIYIYQSNQRQGTSKVKDRAEVSGGGKKPHPQKGTGRARAGSNRSPIWKGGGITFGPTGEQNWKKKTTKNFRRVAFQNAFSKNINDGSLKLIDEIKFDGEALTKQAIDLIKEFENPSKMIIVTSEKQDKTIQAFSNLKNVRIVMVTKLNPYDLLNGSNVLVEQKALDYILEKWGNK